MAEALNWYLGFGLDGGEFKKKKKKPTTLQQ